MRYPHIIISHKIISEERKKKKFWFKNLYLVPSLSIELDRNDIKIKKNKMSNFCCFFFFLKFMKIIQKRFGNQARLTDNLSECLSQCYKR